MITNRCSLLVILLVALLLSACMQQVELGDPAAPTPVSEPAAQAPDGQSGPADSHEAPRRFAQVEMGAPIWFTHGTSIFSIQYPQNWEIEEKSTSSDITTQFHSPERNGMISVTIIEVPNAKQLGAEQLGGLLQDTLTSMFSDAGNLSLSEPERQDDGSIRITLTRDVTQEGFTGTMLANSFVQADSDYISMLLFSLPQEQFDAHTSTINQMLGSYIVYPDVSIGDGAGAEVVPQTAVPTSDTTSSLTPYEGPNGVFSIAIPRGWQVIDRSVSGELLISVVAADGSGMIFVAITDLGESGELVGEDGLSEMLTRGIEQAFGSYTQLSVSEPAVQPDGKLGTQFSFDGAGPIGVMDGVSYAQIDGSYLSMVMVVFSREQATAVSASRDAIINSYMVDPAAPLPQ